MARGRAAERRAARRAERNTTRSNRKDSRRAARLERATSRRDSRDARAAGRQATRQVAYESGINPNAVVGDVLGKGLDLAGDLLSKDSPNLGDANKPKTAADIQAEKNLASGGSQNMLLIGAALVAVFMFMKK